MEEFELIKKEFENLVSHGIFTRELADEILEKIRRKYLNS